MTIENNTQEKGHQVKISKECNEKLESLLLHIEKNEPFARVNKQKLIQHAIDRLSDSDAITLAEKCRDRRALILARLKEDKTLSDPEALIKLLKTDITPTETIEN